MRDSGKKACKMERDLSVLNQNKVLQQKKSSFKKDL